jgi:hypothetical protein
MAFSRANDTAICVTRDHGTGWLLARCAGCPDASRCPVRATGPSTTTFAISMAGILPWLRVAAQQAAPLWRWREMRAATSHAPTLTRKGSAIGDERRGWLLTRPGDGAVLLFTLRDAFTRSVGKSGEGPGEFRSSGLAFWRADSIVVSDPALRRLTVAIEASR